MIKRQAYKFQLKPNIEQVASMKSFSGACRFVYNRALSLQIDNLRAGQKFISYNKMASWLVSWKNQDETCWLAKAPSQILQQSMKDLDKAFTNLFNYQKNHPSFKRKGQKDTFRYSAQRVKLDEINGRILLPKLGWIRYRKSRNISGVLKSVTVSMKLDKWYISLQTEREVEHTLFTQSSALGLDLSNPAQILSSNGCIFLTQSSIEKKKKNLERNIKLLRRKKKHSAKWVKQKYRVDRLLNSISNFRKDYFHKISTTVSKNHAVVVIEHSFSKSSLSKGNRNNDYFSESYELKRQLEYKLAWNGGTLITICKHNQDFENYQKKKTNDIKCDLFSNAKEILAAGHAVIACGGMDNFCHPMKQEPTEKGDKIFLL